MSIIAGIFGSVFGLWGLWILSIALYDTSRWGLTDTAKDLYFGASICFVLGGFLLWLA